MSMKKLILITWILVGVAAVGTAWVVSSWTSVPAYAENN
jgi:hypothetical protein